MISTILLSLAILSAAFLVTVFLGCLPFLVVVWAITIIFKPTVKEESNATKSRNN